VTVRTLLLTALWLFAAALPLRAVNIICSSYPVWLMTRAITNGAGNIAPELLMPSNSGCAHDYLPSVRDMRKACGPDTVLIINGLKLDDHIAQAIKKINRKVVVIASCPPASQFDAHAFISPDTAAYMVQEIARNLSLIDPERKKIYQSNSQQLCSKLADLHKLYCRNQTKKTVVLSGRLFINLAKAANVPVILIRENHNTVLTATQLGKLLQRIRQAAPDAIWQEKNSRDPAVAAIQKDLALPVIELDSMLAGPANPQPDHFLEIMRSNLQKIAGAKQK